MSKAILQEEGRWMKGEEYRPDTAAVETGDPYCGSWRACAVGAVSVCTTGVEPAYSEVLRRSYWAVYMPHTGTKYRDLYEDTVELLNEVVADETYIQFDEDEAASPEFFSMVDYNDYCSAGSSEDDTSLEQVLGIFDSAIQREERRPATPATT